MQQKKSGKGEGKIAVLTATILLLLYGNVWADIGSFLWSQTFGEIGGAQGADVPQGIVFDKAGNIIVVGYAFIGNGHRGLGIDGYAVKYDPEGNQVVDSRWPIILDSDVGGGDDRDLFSSVAVTSNNDLILGGYQENGRVEYLNYVTYKYRFDGQHLWDRQAQLDAWNSIVNVAVDSNDDVFSVGYVFAGHSEPWHDWIIAKYSGADGLSPAGWEPPFYYTGPVSNWYVRDYAYDVAVDSRDDFIVVGTHGVSGSSSDNADMDWHVRKYDSTSTASTPVLHWETSHNGSTNRADYARSVAVDSSDNVFVAGWTNSGTDNSAANRNDDWLITKYTTNGTEMWWQTFESGPGKSERAYVVLVDPANDNIYVGGHRLDGEGNQRWHLEYLNGQDGTRIWHKTWNYQGTIYGLAKQGDRLAVTGTSGGTNSIWQTEVYHSQTDDIFCDGKIELKDIIAAMRILVNADNPTPEDSDATCSDGVDNDGDGFTDCDDWDCNGTNSCSNSENTEQTCTDGQDNDGDGFTDCDDWDCNGTNSCSNSENTEQTCTDGQDNDGDSFIDCNDFDCASYCP